MWLLRYFVQISGPNDTFVLSLAHRLNASQLSVIEVAEDPLTIYEVATASVRSQALNNQLYLGLES